MISERGSVLALVPATVLVVVILAAIAVDSAYVFLAQRALAAEVAGAANDIAGLAVDDVAFYSEGSLALSSAEAETYVARRFGRTPEPLAEVTATVTVSGPSVTVSAVGRVRRIFGAAIPGLGREVEVSARTTATARVA